MKIKQMDISSANDIAGIMTYDIIDVWKVDISFCRDFILSRLAFLNNNEKERYRNFYREEDKLCFAGGRIFTMILAGRYLDKKPEEIDIISEKYMKPFIECAGRLKYSISHSGGCIPSCVL